MMTLIFPPTEVWEGERDTVAFPATVNGQNVRCGISLEALHDHFGAGGGEPIGAFRQNRSAIETIAERLIRQRRIEPDGRVFIRADDC